MASLALPPSIAADAILGFSLAEIAQRRGLSKTAVHRRLAQAGDELPRRRNRRTLAQATIDLLVDLIRTGVLGAREAAREAGVSHQTVLRWRKKIPVDPDAARVVKAYLCPGCRNRVIHDPCTICKLRKRLHEETR